MKVKSKKSSAVKKKVVKKGKKIVKKLKKTAKKITKVKKLKKAARPKKKVVKKKSAKKNVVKKTKSSARKKALPVEVFPWRIPLEGEKLVGVVDDFYQHVGVIALYVKEPLRLGERIHVRGHTTDFTQIVPSMQVEHGQVESVKAGTGVGIKVDQKAHKGNYVYKVL